MTAARKLAILLLALALAAGAPAATAAGGMPLMPDCPMSSSGGEDGCCGGDSRMLACEMACAIGSAAVGGAAGKFVVPEVSAAGIEGHSAHVGLIAGPPDTAPPKSLSA